MTPRWAGRANDAAHIHVFEPPCPDHAVSELASTARRASGSAESVARTATRSPSRSASITAGRSFGTSNATGANRASEVLSVPKSVTGKTAVMRTRDARAVVTLKDTALTDVPEVDTPARLRHRVRRVYSRGLARRRSAQRLGVDCAL